MHLVGIIIIYIPRSVVSAFLLIYIVPLLRIVFMFNFQLIEQTFEACVNDLNSAIRNLQELSLGSSGTNISFLDVSTDSGTERIGSIFSRMFVCTRIFNIIWSEFFLL